MPTPSHELRLVAWDDYRRALGADPPQAEGDVFDGADASSDDEHDEHDEHDPEAGADSPALRAAAKPTFKLASYAPAPSRASASDLHRAINVPTFALVPASPPKPDVDRAPPTPQTAGSPPARANTGGIPKRAPKVLKLTLPPKKRARNKLDPPAPKHTPKRRPLAPKVPNAA